MTEPEQDPATPTIKEVEQRLGFRVGNSGYERLNEEGIPTAVQPTLTKKDGKQLWKVVLDLIHTIDLRNRDVKFWKQKAFQEHERVVALENELESVDAYSVKTSLGD